MQNYLSDVRNMLAGKPTEAELVTAYKKLTNLSNYLESTKSSSEVFSNVNEARINVLKRIDFGFLKQDEIDTGMTRKIKYTSTDGDERVIMQFPLSA